MSSNAKEPIEQAVERALGVSVNLEGFFMVAGAVCVAVSIFTSERGRVYAWPVDGNEVVAMLHQPPIDSPHAAVRAWLEQLAEKVPMAVHA